jgi:hypothetical protein
MARYPDEEDDIQPSCKAYREPPSNTAFQPTPLRGPEIGGILKAGYVLTLVPIYTGGAAEC